MHGLVSGRLDERRRQLERGLDQLRNPQPRVRLAGRRSAPCWLVRLVLLGFGLVPIVVLGAPTPLIVITSLFLLGLAFRPGTFTGCLYCLPLALAWLTTVDGSVLSIRTVVVLGFGTAVPALATIVDGLPATVRIELAVFARPFVRFLIIQLITQPAVFLTGALQSSRLGLLPVAIGGTLVIAVATWLLLPRLSKR